MNIGNTKLVPAIIPEDIESLLDFENKIADKFGYYQIDITDGVFVESKSLLSLPNGDNSSTKLSVPFELDMMVADPIKYIDIWKSTPIEKYIIHFSSTDNITDAISMAKNFNKKVAIAFSINDDIYSNEKIVKMLNPKTDSIQCMGIEKLGFQGQVFTSKVFDQIKIIRDISSDLNISVDGGVSPKHAKALADSGVSFLVAGSALIKGDLDSNIKEFKEALL